MLGNHIHLAGELWEQNEKDVYDEFLDKLYILKLKQFRIELNWKT
jgi:hypothetical protein